MGTVASNSNDSLSPQGELSLMEGQKQTFKLTQLFL